MATETILAGDHADGQRLFACVDGACKFVESQVANGRLLAVLRPFASEAAAREALAAAGATNVAEIKR